MSAKKKKTPRADLEMMLRHQNQKLCELDNILKECNELGCSPNMLKRIKSIEEEIGGIL